ncbi:MAG: TSUP family transporter [Clostridiales bacterium]|nr:TSUP family transporter [Clostridiales bacterium]
MLLAITGTAAGIISGMGIGGGIILIPVLVLAFGIGQHTAQNINLIYFVPTAVVALVTHIKNRKIEKKAVLKIVFAGVVGAIIGAVIAIAIEPAVLGKLFGGFLLLMGIIEFFKKK